MYKKVVSEKDTLNYWEQGSGEVLVFIPSLWITDWSYRGIIKKLSKHYKVVVPDLNRGRTRYDRVSWKLENHVQKVKVLVDILGLKKFVLVGMSFGGLVALKYSQMFPSDTKITLSVSAMPLDYRGKSLRFVFGYFKSFFLNTFSLRGIVANLMWVIDGAGYLVKHPRQFFFDGAMAVQDHRELLSVSAEVWVACRDEFVPRSSVITLFKGHGLDIKEIDGRHAWFFLEEDRFVEEIKSL
ncbi:MAG: alpha/beta hydrolase [Patescibacteria group bacterium]